MRVDCKWSKSREFTAFGISLQEATGSLLITMGSRVEELRMLDGGRVNENRRYNTSVRCLALSLDESLIAVGESGGLLSVRGNTGVVVTSVTHSSAVRCVSFSPTRNDCLSASEESIRVWLSDVHAFFRIPVPRPCLCAAWSVEGNSFVYGLVDGTFVFVDRNQLDSRVWVLNFSCSIWCCVFLNAVEVVIGTWDPPALSLISIDTATVVSQTSLSGNPTCAYRLSDHMFFVGDSQGNVFLYGTSAERKLALLKQVVANRSEFVSSISMDRNCSLFVSTFNGTLSCYRIRFQHLSSTSTLVYAQRDPACLSRVFIHTLEIGSIVSMSASPGPGLVNAIGVTDDQVSILTADKFVHTYRLIKDRMIPLYQFEIEKIMHSVKLISPSACGVIVIHNEGTELSCLTTTGQVTTSISLSSPIELITPISDSNFLLLSASGNIHIFNLQDAVFHKHFTTPCRGARLVCASLRRTCIAVLEHSGDLFVFDSTVQVCSTPNIISCMWSITVDGLLAMTKGDATVWVWDRHTQRDWMVGSIEPGSTIVKFSRNIILFINKNGKAEEKLLLLNKIIPDILHFEERNIVSAIRAYHIAVQCGCEPRVLDTVGETALRLGEIRVAKICFKKSNNRRFLFLSTLPNIDRCPEGYLDLAKGDIEKGVMKLWGLSQDTREECIQILMGFNEWSVLLNLGGPQCLRDALDACEDRYAAGHGYFEIGDLKNAINAFMTAGANEQVMQCVNEETLEIAIKYFDSVDDWGRLRMLLDRLQNPQRTSESHAKRNRWKELLDLSRKDASIKPFYLMLHGKYLTCSETGVIEGLWEQIRSGMIPTEEISIQCKRWTKTFVDAKNYRIASCVTAIDPHGEFETVVLLYAYSIVLDEHKCNSPFCVHDTDLVLNCAVYLYNIGGAALQEVVSDLDPRMIASVLIQRLFDSGNLASALHVFRLLQDHEGLSADLRRDLLALCDNDQFCEDNPHYTMSCFTCNVLCPLMSPGDRCASCSRPFNREMCLMDVMGPIPKYEEREFGRRIIRQCDVPMIVCLYCKNVFTFFRYVDDSECKICHCLWWLFSSV